ncbi:hypothetical protein [Arthrobacter zhaoxinii]|uniref:hypothetical protein n=1 Tax=Arthrobacter zhaoxinii TaxID=2964616 RepID=UPI00210690E8|nr:hypothetical protein [Arthrobacter zhaoxinii]MCQ2000346.1 hypothetical protein [Arthrobacter zhaoxinii]
MSEHPDAQDRLYVRSLLAEAGVEETPELVEALLALRSESRVPVPEPEGELAALFEGAPMPLRPRRKGGRGIILGTALIGAMAVGAGGVAANPDFLVRADPTPIVSFTPEVPTAEVPPLERVEPAEPAEPEVAADPVAPAAVTEPEPNAVVEDSPALEPEPKPDIVVVPAPVVEPGGSPLPGAGDRDGNGPVPDPQPGRNRHDGGHPGHSGDRGQNSGHAGAGMPDRHGSAHEDSGRGNGRGNDGAHPHGRGPSGPGR